MHSTLPTTLTTSRTGKMAPFVKATRNDTARMGYSSLWYFQMRINGTSFSSIVPGAAATGTVVPASASLAVVACTVAPLPELSPFLPLEALGILATAVLLALTGWLSFDSPAPSGIVTSTTDRTLSCFASDATFCISSNRLK